MCTNMLKHIQVNKLKLQVLHLYDLVNSIGKVLLQYVVAKIHVQLNSAVTKNATDTISLNVMCSNYVVDFLETVLRIIYSPVGCSVTK